jgi:hypothetical protein
MSLILPKQSRPPSPQLAEEDDAPKPFETPMFLRWQALRQAVMQAEPELVRAHSALVGIVNSPITLTANQLRTIARMALHGQPIPCTSCFAQVEHEGCLAWDTLLKPAAPNRDTWDALRVQESGDLPTSERLWSRTTPS